jgi:hypothetical protein
MGENPTHPLQHASDTLHESKSVARAEQRLKDQILCAICFP